MANSLTVVDQIHYCTILVLLYIGIFSVVIGQTEIRCYERSRWDDGNKFSWRSTS